MVMLLSFIFLNIKQGRIQGGGPGGPGPPLTTKNEAPAPKLRPQNGSFRPVTIWGPPPDQILDLPLLNLLQKLLEITAFLLKNEI